MTLRKFKITYQLNEDRVIEQTLDGVTYDSLEAAVQQKLSQKHLIFITGDVKMPYLTIETERVLRYQIEEIGVLQTERFLHQAENPLNGRMRYPGFSRALAGL